MKKIRGMYSSGGRLSLITKGEEGKNSGTDWDGRGKKKLSTKEMY